MVHPTFVLICGSKYLLVWRAGSQPCSWHGGIAAWWGSRWAGGMWELEIKTAAARDADPRGDSVNADFHRIHKETWSWSFKTLRRKPMDSLGWSLGFLVICSWLGSNYVALCWAPQPRASVLLFSPPRLLLCSLLLRWMTHAYPEKITQDLSNRISNLGDWKVRRRLIH